ILRSSAGVLSGSALTVDGVARIARVSPRKCSLVVALAPQSLGFALSTYGACLVANRIAAALGGRNACGEQRGCKDRELQHLRWRARFVMSIARSSIFHGRSLSNLMIDGVQERLLAPFFDAMRVWPWNSASACRFCVSDMLSYNVWNAGMNRFR